MAEEEVKLFGVWASPFSRRVEIALKMKGIKYEYIEEDLFNKSPLLLKYNPVHKKIPVLLHNGKPIAESLVILEYIDETWKNGAPILPEDPCERALARFWAKFIDEKCWPAVRIACKKSGEEQEKDKNEVSEALQFLENELKDKKFFGGDNLGFVDIVANFLALYFGVLEQVFGVELLAKEKHPNLCRWLEEYLSCSIVSESMPDKDKLIAYLKARLQAAAPK